MTTPITFSLEDTLALIAEKASALKGSNRPPTFDLNLSRRNTAGVPQSLASFSGATLEHIQDPVRWLPSLCGGGEYILNVRHEDLPGRIGGPIGVNFDKTAPGMEPRAVDPRVARSPHWAGPQLTGGAFVEPPPNGHAGASVLSPGVFSQGLTTGYGLPVTGPAPASDREREMAQQLADLRTQNARIEAESKARAELEAMKREADTRVREVQAVADRALRESETRTQQQIAALQANARPAPDPGAGLEKLTAVIMPLVQQMLTAQHEMRMLSMKMSEEQNRRQIEASEKQHQTQMEMIRSITAQKPGMSDEMKMLIETLKAGANSNGTDAIASLMGRQLEAMGMVQKMSINMIETVADMQMGESEHPAVGAVREFAAAMKVMMSGSKEAGQRVIPKKALPAGQKPQLTPAQIAQIQQQQRAQQAAQQAQARAAVAGRQPPPPQGNPAPAPAPVAGPRIVNVGPQTTTTVPQPIPVMTFVSPAPAEQPATAVAPLLPDLPGGASYFDALKQGISAKQPVSDIIDFFAKLKNADEPSLREALDKHNGSPWQMVQAEFGMKFITQNMPYFEELGEAIDARGIEEGWWPESTDDDDGEEEQQEEAAPEAEAPTMDLGEATIPLDVAPAQAVPESAALSNDVVVVVPTVPPSAP